MSYEKEKMFWKTFSLNKEWKQKDTIFLKCIFFQVSFKIKTLLESFSFLKYILR